MKRFVFIIYRFVAYLLFVVLFPVFFVVASLSGWHREGLGERLGHLPVLPPPSFERPRLWLHAASVGEVLAALVLIAELERRVPAVEIVLSTVTVTGRRLARERLAGRVPVFLAPLDLPHVVRRALDRVRPAAYVCLETELWPSLLLAAAARQIRLFLVNGRMSARSFRRYRLLRPLTEAVFSRFAGIGVVGIDDAGRYVALGADAGRVKVLGNVKYELPAAGATTAQRHRWREALGLAADAPLWIAGSTHKGEEEALAEVYCRLRREKDFRGLVWLLAPRHPERLARVEALLRDRGLAVERCTAVLAHGRRRDIVLLDTMGDLASLYAAADFVFIGGSLSKHGGHNPMEAAAHGQAIFHGPHMQDFAAAAALLAAEGAAYPVGTVAELHEKMLAAASQPKRHEEAGRRAAAVVRAHQGAAGRQVEMVAGMLAACGPPAARPAASNTEKTDEEVA